MTEPDFAHRIRKRTGLFADVTERAGRFHLIFMAGLADIMSRQILVGRLRAFRSVGMTSSALGTGRKMLLVRKFEDLGLVFGTSVGSVSPSLYKGEHHNRCTEGQSEKQFLFHTVP
jgi:hypothetical protein